MAQSGTAEAQREEKVGKSHRDELWGYKQSEGEVVKSLWERVEIDFKNTFSSGTIYRAAFSLHILLVQRLPWCENVKAGDVLSQQ